MNVKRFFGILLTLLGIAGLVYAGYLFINVSGGERNFKIMAIDAILGFVFFIAGISLVRATRDTPTA